MRVYFNDLVRLRSRSGISVYAEQLSQALRKQTSLDLIPFSTTVAARPLVYATRYLRGKASPGAMQARGFDWMDRYFSWVPLGLSKGIYHEPDAIPLHLNRPTVTTVHDLTVLLYPEWHPAYRVEKYERRMRDAIQRTDHFIAVSETTKRDIVRLLGVRDEKITVILEAPRFGIEASNDSDVITARKKFQLPRNYFICVGTLEPRKNIERLLDAFESLPKTIQSEYPLVLAGAWGWKSDSISERLNRATYVKHIGCLCDPDLIALVTGATALVYPSVYEGFGLPPLEAMAVGTPVITTNGGALAETVGNAAVVVDPLDVEAMRSAMNQMVSDSEYRSQYRTRGLEHVRRFSWDEAARRTVEVYRDLDRSQ